MRVRLAILGAFASIATAVLMAGCGGDDDSASTGADERVVGGAGCRQVDPPPRRSARAAPKPTRALDRAKTYDVIFRTSCGSFTIRLDVHTSPKTSASFVSLVRRGFFDETAFHRIVPGFAVQGGDPTATGRGGPGYSTVEPPPKRLQYVSGTVAMAKAPSERRGTAGSQFFVITGDAGRLKPDYALLGSVVAGVQVTRRIGELGDPSSGDKGTPTQLVLIDEARVRVRGAGHAGGHGGAKEPGRRGRLSCGPGVACPEG